VAEGTGVVRAVAEREQLVNADPFQVGRLRLDRVQDRHRLAVAGRHDDVGTGPDVLEDRAGARNGSGDARQGLRLPRSSPPGAAARDSSAHPPARAPGTPRSPSDRCRGWATSPDGWSSRRALARRHDGSVARPPPAARPDAGATRAWTPRGPPAARAWAAPDAGGSPPPGAPPSPRVPRRAPRRETAPRAVR